MTWLRHLGRFRVRRDDFPWPHWELTDGHGHDVLLWPWTPIPVDLDTDTDEQETRS